MENLEDLKGKLGDKVNQEISILRFMAGNFRIYYRDSFSGVILNELGLNVLRSKQR